MSNLIKPYEISVWDDVWENGAFSEKRLGVIGTDKMQSQNRALEANFSRNVNGVKKLSFKMYKQYKDSITGEDITNPYIDWLVSERKVKLYYEDQWHDFIIKNISENSSNYLYTYQLEDALVQELSKNGFGKVLDAKLKNNMGTANQLATGVLEETDWTVAADSEAFVQTIDEALVYLTLPSSISGLNIKHIKDQTALTSGISVENATGITGGKTILAFYSSCTNKPHRFQFIYVSDLSSLQRDENRNIINKDCQYYIDFNNPERQYSVKNETYNFYLPTGFNTTTIIENNVGSVTLSSLYRGKRYGFAQQSRYIPILNKYVKLYDKSGEEYYGYQHTEYNSPALTQNVISNTTFESTSGWTGTHNAVGKEKAKIEHVFGYFESGRFVDSINELKSGTFMELDADGKPKKNYKAYLKITFPNKNARIINSGPFDNRTLIGKMEPGDEWALRYICKDATGRNASGFSISLGEYSYVSSTDGYSLIEEPKITFNALTGSKTNHTLTKNGKTYGLIKVNTSTYSAEDFKKKMKVRVCIDPPSQISTETVYYLEEIELFKATFNKDKVIIIPEEQGIDLEDRVIDKTYYYFKPSALEGISNEEQLVPETISKTLSYEIYKPKYNDGAQKIRSVSAKESNYFNILQSIAETFEAWLVLKITRDDPDEPGKITKKEIAFKNYAGNKNYAGFRYGVNLKDIQRTYESKNIVTKLIVKQNSNELGENGFCTIARAGANPTGENCIYDFQYFFNRGLIDPTNYLNTMYVVDGQSGPDVNSGTEYNLQGYFPRIKALNNLIQEQNEILINTAKDLTQYKAELETAEAGKEAANSGVEQTRDDFEALTGVPIDQISVDKIAEVSLPGGKQNDEDNAKEKYGYYHREADWLESVRVSINGRNITVNGTIKTEEISQTARDLYVKVYPKVTLKNNKIIGTEYTIKCTFEGNQQSGQGSVQVEIVDVDRTDIKRLLQEFAVYNSNELKYTADMEAAQENVNTTQAVYDAIDAEIEQYKTHKINLNQKFFSQYSRFIQEGTWINEEYVDDEKYYADALSVMYNSCYPQVAYSINVVELSRLPGYEHFTYGLGDRTYVEDFEFFGEGKREEVIITEINEVLDDPSKNVIKVQNFKNQFQDLFQKITATVQQAQYSTGSYEKAVALAEANQTRKQQFLTDALDSASARLSTAGQQSVTWGNDGITVKSVNSPCDAIRMVGGAILLSKQDANGEQKWVTGVTSDGVSASLITAGIINAGEITIMNYDQPVFRWDSFGITAYDANWYDDEAGTVISGVNSRKFVRFDKHGIYGIDNSGVDGANWYPSSIDEIDRKATFALTWEGLKVTGNAGGTARLGKQNGYIMLVRDSSGDGTFGITEDGKIQTRGIEITNGTIGGQNLASTNYADGMASTAKSEAIAAAQGLVSGLESTLGGNIEEIRGNLQEQIDGNISTYFLPYLPTASRYPVTNGTSSDGPGDGEAGWSNKYVEHNGDLFYITSPNGEVFTQTNEPTKQLGIYWIHPNNNQEIIIQKCVVTSDDDSTLKWETLAANSDEAKIVEKVGYCYRWQYTDSTNKTTPTNNNWVLITDTAIAEALADAAKAQDTADSKRTVYSELPGEGAQIQPGDLLIPTSANGIYKAGRVYKYINNADGWKEIEYTDSDVNTNNFSWKFDKDNGMMMWSGAQPSSFENYNMASDANLMFRVYKDGTKGKLWMKGTGEFSGTISASTIVGGTFKNQTETLYLSTSSKNFTINGSQKNCVFRIGNYFGVDSKGNFYASGNGQIGNWTLDNGALYYSDGNILLHPTGKDDSVKINDISYSGKFMLKVGTNFGVTNKGELYCTLGNVANWTIDHNGLYSGKKFAAGILSTEAYGEEAYSDKLNIKNGVVIGVLDGYGSTIRIPPSYGGYTVYKIGDQAFENKTNITEVILPNTITEIGWRAFNKCTILRRVEINSAVKIGKHAFMYCNELQSLLLPKGTKFIGEQIFFTTAATPITLYFEDQDGAVDHTEGWKLNRTIEEVYSIKKMSAKSLLSGIYNDTYSDIKIFTGSKGLPSLNNHANFMVLEDGSFYSSAAKIGPALLGYEDSECISIGKEFKLSAWTLGRPGVQSGEGAFRINISSGQTDDNEPARTSSLTSEAIGFSGNSTKEVSLSYSKGLLLTRKSGGGIYIDADTYDMSDSATNQVLRFIPRSQNRNSGIYDYLFGFSQGSGIKYYSLLKIIGALNLPPET